MLSEDKEFIEGELEDLLVDEDEASTEEEAEEIEKEEEEWAEELDILQLEEGMICHILTRRLGYCVYQTISESNY